MMKAMRLEAVGKLALVETDRPTLSAPDQVLIKVVVVGICGSELHAFEGTHPYRKPPTILGHEVVGTVIESGKAVTRCQPGDRVTVDPQWPCGECEWCQRGEVNLCPEKRVLGTPAWPGALGEYFVIPECSVFPLPAHLTTDQGVTVEPLGVGVHAVKRARLQAGEAVLILGTGAIGHMVAAMAAVRGAGPIIVADVKPHCLESAQRLGATHTILVGEDSITERVMDITGGRGVEVVFLTADVDWLVDEAFNAVCRKGRIVFIALFNAPIHLNPYRIIQKDLDVIGSIMSTEEDFNEALALVAAGKVQAEAIVTHHLPLAQAQHGFELAASKADGAIKVVLEFPG